MKLDKKMEYYLRHFDIEFSENYLLEVLPQNEDYAIVLTAPKSLGEYKYFRLMHKNGHNEHYSTIERLANVCVERNYLNRREADKLIKEYHNLHG